MLLFLKLLLFFKMVLKTKYFISISSAGKFHKKLLGDLFDPKQLF